MLFGQRTTTLEHYGLTTNTTCAIADYYIIHPNLRSAYFKLSFGSVFVVNVVMSASYFFISRALRISQPRLKRVVRPQDRAGVSISCVTTARGSDESIRLATLAPAAEIDIQSHYIDETNIRMRTNNKVRSEARTKANSREHRLAVIGFVVTLVFMLSFVPLVAVDSILLITQVDPEQLQGVHFALHTVFMRSFFFNLISNPVIYGVLNVKFRTAVYDIFRKSSTRTQALT